MRHIGREELGYIEQAVLQGLSGAFNRRFEEAFAAKLGVNFAVGVNSGTSALYCALAATGIGPGDEVIVPPITFAAPAMAVLQRGAVPVFADVDAETFTIHPADIERKITSRTRAVIPVAIYGLPADLDPIMALAGKHDLAVIEDNAQCFLGRYKNRLAGTIGHIAIYSFERSKHMTTGSGGMVVTNDEKLAERTRKHSVLGYASVSARQASYKLSKDHVQRPDYMRHELVGQNLRLPEICAAMGLAQLEKLDTLVARRREVARFYDEAVSGCQWLRPQKTPMGSMNAYWTYAIVLEEEHGVSWADIRRIYLEEGGDRYYAAWAVNYLEPALFNLVSEDHSPLYRHGMCPVAETLQKSLIQMKTNYDDADQMKTQSAALARTIDRLS